MKTLLSLLLVCLFSSAIVAEDVTPPTVLNADEKAAVDHFKLDASKLVVGMWLLEINGDKLHMEFKSNGDFIITEQDATVHVGHWDIKPNTFIIETTLNPPENKDPDVHPDGDSKPVIVEFLFYTPECLVNPMAIAHKIQQ